MDTHERIEEIVADNPGIGFRELKRKSGNAVGTVQYHVDQSDTITRKRGAILPILFCHDCGLHDLCAEYDNRCLYNVLRDSVKREIVNGVLANKSNATIADELDLDRSTVTYHINDLKEKGIITEEDSIPACIEDVLASTSSGDK